ncbi:MAG: S8 family serine peptidase [Gammaproteobacteria bacterium]|nr:S8 family serine peptidase [Gammaproteobacteria bacterium]
MDRLLTHLSSLPRRAIVAGVCFLGMMMSSFTAAALPPPSVSSPTLPFRIQAEHVPGEIIVKFRGKPLSNPVAARDVAAVHAAIEARVVATMPFTHVQRVRGARGQATEALMAAYARRADVEFVEPNYIFHVQATPNDPRFPEQWSLSNTGQTGGTPGVDIGALKAWDRQKGNAGVIVADIDTGVDYTHPDLAANMWVNAGEIAGNGIDDDGNGYVDDVRGWDFANNDNNPMDDHGHGTHTAGTIGAVGNNAIGVTGVAWNVRIMPLKFISGSGSGTSFGAAQAIVYAARMGARISSNSWGGGAFSQTIENAIATANQLGMLFVVAAGNANANNDTTASFPCNSTQPNVLCVAATDSNDQKASFSSYGALNVDLGAPGVSILSTVPTASCAMCSSSGYRFASGTSMATPHVSGAAALVRSQFPALGAVEIKNLLMSSVDKVPALTGRTVTGGRLNVARAVSAATAITVTARGTPVSGVYPIMQVRVDGQVIGSFNVNSDAYADYAVTAPLTPGVAHNVDVVFTNDAYVAPEDRNLIVQSLRVNATTLLPTASGVTYDRGAGSAAFDGVDVIAGQSGMWWNGALRFAVPAAAF